MCAVDDRRVPWAMSKTKRQFVPVTPAGTPCTWLAAPTEEEAWGKLLKDAAHMPYRGVAGFKQRGYTVQTFKEQRHEQ